jgi:hypothetical protein
MRGLDPRIGWIAGSNQVKPGNDDRDSIRPGIPLVLMDGAVVLPFFPLPGCPQTMPKGAQSGTIQAGDCDERYGIQSSCDDPASQAGKLSSRRLQRVLDGRIGKFAKPDQQHAGQGVRNSNASCLDDRHPCGLPCPGCMLAPVRPCRQLAGRLAKGNLRMGSAAFASPSSGTSRPGVIM